MNCALKFIYSKTTKTTVFTYLKVKSKVNISQHFVAFSEYINFKVRSKDFSGSTVQH